MDISIDCFLKWTWHLMKSGQEKLGQCENDQFKCQNEFLFAKPQGKITHTEENPGGSCSNLTPVENTPEGMETH